MSFLIENTEGSLNRQIKMIEQRPPETTASPKHLLFTAYYLTFQKESIILLSQTNSIEYYGQLE